MPIHRDTHLVPTRPRSLTNITDLVNASVTRTNANIALATVFIHHTSASLVITENADPTVLRDHEAHMSRLVKDGDPIFQHTDEGPDDMSAHVKSVLTATSLSIPVVDGKLDLGVWQGVFVWEHRSRAHERRVSVTVVS